MKYFLSVFPLQVVGEALLWTLQDMLDTKCTNEVTLAWTELYNFITKTMLRGILNNNVDKWINNCLNTEIKEWFARSISITNYIISPVIHAFWLVLTYDLLKDRRIDDVIIKIFFLILYYIKQIDSKLSCVCSVVDHRGRKNVVRASVTHSAAPRVPLFCSYHILTSSVIYYWTDARQLGIYMLNGSELKRNRWKKMRKIESFASCFIHGLLFLDTFYVYQFFFSCK